MANEYLINRADLVSVADAIRERAQTSDPLVFPNEFVTAINNLGGSGATLTVTTPAEGITVTVTKGELIYTKTTGADGTSVFSGLETGTWTIMISDGSNTETDTVDLVADYTKALSFVKIYGIYRDITASSPAWAREDDAVGMTATASIGTVAGYSDFSSRYPWSEIHRETISTGDVMVKIPKFWFRRYIDGNIEHIKISNMYTDGFTLHPAFNHSGIERDYLYVGAYKTSSNNKSVSGSTPQRSQTRATFRTNSKAKGNGWGLIDISAISAIQMLIMVEFATNNVQAVIGRGYCDNNSDAAMTGTCDSVPNLTGRPAGTDGKVDVVWRGIEGLWGNISEFVDGANFNDGKYYVCNDQSMYADDTSTGYEKLSFTGATNWSSSYITKEGIDNGNNTHIMLPSAAGSGSESTHQCDGCWSNTGWRTLRSSGNYYMGSVVGLFTAIITHSSTTSEASSGSRLIYVPQ